ncbi:MAG: M23 family metallopeptidase [Spirochaetia bacterium]|nr:M23 family metallopeptidase [Spirochaetia bacterium]
MKCKAKFVFGFLFLNISVSFIFSSAIPISTNQTNANFIEDLSYKNQEIINFRKEVHDNIRVLKINDTVNLKWRKYKIKKEDNFYKIMSVTMLDHDTISTVNKLNSAYETKTEDIWLLPNVRGMAILKKDKNKFIDKYGVSKNLFFNIPENHDYLFVPRVSKIRINNNKKQISLSDFIKPAKGIISSNYGLRDDPFLKKKKFHKGIDIACPKLSPVSASESGKVIFSSAQKDYGKTIIIEHENGYQTIYAHLNKILVKKGNLIQKGEKIGLSGKTGKSTAPHLHFEIRRKGRPVRPRF